MSHLNKLSYKNPQRVDYVYLIMNATFVFMLTQIVPMILYYFVRNYTTIPKEYMDNLIAKCPAHTITKVFDERAFPYIGKTALGYGAYLGILFHHRFLTSNTTN